MPQIMDANAKELHIIEFLAGLDAQLIQGEKILQERLKLIPNGWRNFRLAVTTTQRVLDGVYETLPIKTLKHMDRLCQCGQVIIRPRPMIKMPDDAQIVLSDDLKLITNMIIAQECAMCLKSPPEQKRCKLRRALENIAPTEEIHKDGLCCYTFVAAAHDLGDYI